jgi:glycosyltransferase involved in cell wall biosynthesis
MRQQEKFTVMQLINSYSLAGAEKLVFDLATKLDKQLFNVLICSIGKSEDKSETTIREKLESNGIVTLSLAKPHHKKRLLSIWRLYHYLKEYHVSILHTHCPSPDFYGKIAAFLAHIPVVTTIHNVQGYRAINEYILKRLTTKYVAISKTVERYAISELKIPSTKIQIIYNAVDIDKFTKLTVNREAMLKELGITGGGKVITCVGNVAKRKGHLYLIKAAKKVTKIFPNTHFLLVGNERAEPEVLRSLKAIIETEHLQDKIIFTGVRSDIPSILSITDIFVLPSLWEGLSIALLEAMAAGVAVIVTNVGSNPEVVSNGINGFVIPPRDSEVIAQKIIELLSAPAKARDLGLAGQKKVKKLFTLNKMVHGYEDLYLRCLGRNQEH